jgi:hypothetical protein
MTRGEVNFAAGCKRNSSRDSPQNIRPFLNNLLVPRTPQTMPPRRQSDRNTNAIVASSSSDTSEASEDCTPESDPDSPSSHRGFATDNNMSERQTQKLNAGRFGMFNHPTLMPRTPEKGRKRKRVKEYSDYVESPRAPRRKERRGRKEAIETSDEDEGNAEDKRENDDERARNTEEYLDVFNLVNSAEARVRVAESTLSTMISEHKSLEFKLAAIDATAENGISDILRQRDEVIRIATEHAEAKIRRVRQRVPRKKTQYERKLHDVSEQRKGMEQRTMELKAALEVIKGKKVALEQQDRSEMYGGLRDVQARQRQ